jgi:23S rRNA pseudouridine1911/1915/1917 synthase
MSEKESEKVNMKITDFDIKVVFENENVLAINKPLGLLVHGDGRRQNVTLVDWISKNYPDIVGVGEDIFINEKTTIARPGIVHRLDKDTTGIMLIAKNQDTFYSLKEQFKNRSIKKNYRAFVYGAVKFDKKTILAEIGRSKTDFRKWTTNRGVRGEVRLAETQYNLLEKNEDFSYLDIFPKTGRTHQIRVHLKHDNYPIIADHLYAGKKYDRELPAEDNLFFTTQALHAYSIEFTDLDGKKIRVIAPIPESFEKALKFISK